MCRAIRLQLSGTFTGNFNDYTHFAFVAKPLNPDSARSDVTRSARGEFYGAEALVNRLGLFPLCVTFFPA
jgi:hypothetical protein